jgi:hypothetical protein
MSATKNPLYAAVGAGATAFEKAKELPQRVITLPQKLQGSNINLDIRELPKQAREQFRSLDIRVELPKLNLKPKAVLEQAKSLSNSATERATKAYAEFTKVGEAALKQIRKNGSKKPAARKTTAKAKATAPKKAESNGSATDTTTAQN